MIIRNIMLGLTLVPFYICLRAYSFLYSPNYVEITKPNMAKIGFKKALTDKDYYKDYIYYTTNNNEMVKAKLMINKWTRRFAYVYNDIIIDDVEPYRL